MPWLLIKLAAAGRDADTVADALSAAGALSVTIEGTGAEQRLQAACERHPLWRESGITGLFPEHTDAAAVVASVRASLGAQAAPDYCVNRLADADWERAWMARYQPQRVAPGLWVTPSWCAPPDPTATNIVLDPGLAFGTGTHPTTRLCLTWLAAQPLAGRNVIDYGCGSGILAIAALKLGAARATGIDVDPQAVAASRENAARNGVGGRFIACTPDGVPPQAKADLLVANILSTVLIALAPELSARLAPDGRLALSGILAEQTAEVRAAYAPPFTFTTRRRDGWMLLAGRRR